MRIVFAFLICFKHPIKPGLPAYLVVRNQAGLLKEGTRSQLQ